MSFVAPRGQLGTIYDTTVPKKLPRLLGQESKAVHSLRTSRSFPTLLTASSQKQTVQNFSCSQSELFIAYPRHFSLQPSLGRSNIHFDATASKTQLCFFLLSDFFHFLEAVSKLAAGRCMRNWLELPRISKRASSQKPPEPPLFPFQLLQRLCCWPQTC